MTTTGGRLGDLDRAGKTLARRRRAPARCRGRETGCGVGLNFDAEVHLSNVRLDEILRVEIYRRGLHSDAFAKGNLRPGRAEETDGTELSAVENG